MKFFVFLCFISIVSCEKRKPVESNESDDARSDVSISDRSNYDEALIALCKRHGCLPLGEGDDILETTFGRIGNIGGDNGLLSGVVGQNGILGGVTGQNGLLGGVADVNGLLGGATGQNGLLGGVTGKKGLLGGLLGNNGLTGKNSLLGGLLGNSGIDRLLKRVNGLLNRLTLGLQELLKDVLKDSGGHANGPLVPQLLSEIVAIAESILGSGHRGIDDGYIAIIIQNNAGLAKCISDLEIDLQVVVDMVVKSICFLSQTNLH